MNVIAKILDPDNVIDYRAIKNQCYFKIVNKEHVDLSIIIPVHGRTQFHNIISQYFRRAIDASGRKVSLTFVEHSDSREHEAILHDWVNYIHIPLNGKRFNKCLAHNIGALYSNPCDFYLFHDVDILIPNDLITKLFQNIIGYHAVQSFTKRRVLYCNEGLTNTLLNGTDSLETIFENHKDVTTGGGKAPGGSMMVSREIFQRVGGYDPELFSEYSVEDQFFYDKLNIFGRLGHSDRPPIEMFHMHHPPSFGQTTKNEDWAAFHAFHALSGENKQVFADIKRTHIGKYYEMEKQTIKIYDTQFAHGASLGCGDLGLPPKFFNWYRGNDKIGDIAFITESMFHMVDSFPEPRKIGLIIEPPQVIQTSYNLARQPDFYNKFEFIFTYNKELINMNPEKFKFYPFGGCWIYPHDRLVHPKDRGISIIASGKRDTVGHKLRHEVIERFKDRIHGVYGRGYHQIGNKIEVLKHYAFQIVIENDDSDTWFTEKLIDCFMTGTIPIFWGCKSITEHFNKDGMMIFNNLDELDILLSVANGDYYNNCMPYIMENFQRALLYTSPEDWIWRNYLCKMI